MGERLLDDNLLRRIQKGDRHAFRIWYDENAPGLLQFFSAYAADRSEARDLMQDLMLQLFRKMELFMSAKNPKAYLFQTARNLALSKLRQRGRESRAVERLESGGTLKTEFRPLTEGSSEEEKNFALRASQEMTKLPDDQKEAILLHLFENFSFREIEEMTGEPLQTWYRRYSSGIEKIRKAMSDLITEE